MNDDGDGDYVMMNDEWNRWFVKRLCVAVVVLGMGLGAAGQEGRSQIAVFDFDSGGVERVMVNGFVEEEPEWSPDGAWILFDSDREGSRDLYVVRVDGTGLKQLTDSGAKEDHGAWSPDGKRIAYQHEAGGNTDVYVMNADGSGKRRLTDHAARDGWPDWSPDGERIVFSSDREGGKRSIYVMNGDGTGQRRLLRGLVDGNGTDPAWSADGGWIAFGSDHFGASDLFVMRSDGSDVRRVVGTLYNDERPVWSADGDGLIYSRVNQRTGLFEVREYRLDSDEDRRVSPEGIGMTRADVSRDGGRLLVQLMNVERREAEAVFADFDLGTLDEFVGRYELVGAPGLHLVITRRGDWLYGERPGGERDRLVPSGEREFYLANHDGRVTFERDDTGRIERVNVRLGRVMEGLRAD